MKIKLEKDQGQQTILFSSRYQINANIMKSLVHARPPGEHVTCISSSNLPSNSETGIVLQ